ncbi:hypothetical protein MtrunA17_Chr3g0100141 [Medicago truncatula]|uniref:Uncharacterized protein n=1 Tax=Medicago truncatula TaxID=3880 RepID=A0A396IW84_MEDTR|nr:hypothetical protein MtrunA17_Chr3g0100141 [Medicago truncatula]
METMVRTSSRHPNCSPIKSILASGGSSGNSTIFQPSSVNLPALLRAPNIHNWYIELRILSCGGGSMKSKSSKFSTLRDFSNKTTLPRLVL